MLFRILIFLGKIILVKKNNKALSRKTGYEGMKNLPKIGKIKKYFQFKTGFLTARYLIGCGR